MIRLLVALEDIAAKTLLAAITALVCFAAVGRSLGHPLIWSVDMAQLMFIWLCFLGANRAMRAKAHIGVDLLARRFPAGLRWGVEIALACVALGFLAVLLVAGVRLTLQNWQRIYGDSGVSYAWVTSAVPAGAALLAATVLTNLVDALKRRALVFYPDRELDRSDSQLG
ncbi:MAG: TRAP transporter small permease [Methylobacteriaceae bacterium]|nr:TRAP transporter small permease [Methylobacteriaceae bacterium]